VQKRLNIIFFIFLTSIFLFLTYHQSICSYPSDTSEHIKFTKEFFHHDRYIPHPLWHICSYTISKLFNIQLTLSAAICSTFLLVLWSILVYVFIIKNINDNFKVRLSMMIIIMIGPLCIPWYNKIIYYGQGSPNIWHNVTLWSVKPFALLSTWLSIDGLYKKDIKKLTLATIFTLISIFAKPSFIIMFLPALLLYAIARQEYKDMLFVKFYAIVSGLSIMILLYQYTHTFNQQEGKIIIDFLGVWSLTSQNISVSILLALAFPMAFISLHSKILQDRYILISWIMIFISIAYYATFAQTGRFYTHGNFGWSYMIAMSLLYLFSIVKYFEIYTSLHIVKKVILNTLLLVQTIIGIYYLYHILIGQNPLYVSIWI
jgi:hypothetical protein